MSRTPFTITYNISPTSQVGKYRLQLQKECMQNEWKFAMVLVMVLVTV